ncbi:hypothetical protein HOB10_00825 [Candidatus Parcubacteria bacterium]|nr:hypothetical protein [Candidatus Parcubacteria bacterium]
MNIEIKKNSKFSNLVNFSQNHEERVHRWFKIKEGYSKELVFAIIKQLDVKEGYIVDFFNGSGTTSLAAKEIGYKYYGFEINPFLHLLSVVKITDYNKNDIKNIISTKKFILSDYTKVKKVNNIKLSILEKVFRENLDNILKVRTIILGIKSKKIRNFFIIALVSILEDVGYSKKDGNGLKYPKNKQAKEFVSKFSAQTDLMLDDIIKNNKKNIKKSRVILADSRNIPKRYINEIKNETSLIIFSPPYANCFDYSEVYKLELWLSDYIKEYKDLSVVRKQSLSSHLNKHLKDYNDYDLLINDIEKLKQKKLWSKKIPSMLNGYFFDMEEVLKNAFNILKKGGHCVIIVGNSAYGGHIIKTDVILSKIGLRLGFSKVEINIARKLRASSQQAKLFKNGEALRESVIIMTK